MKKIFITSLQILVTVCALGWVFKDAEQRHKMAIAFREANLWWVLAAVAAGMIAPVTATLRWWLLLRAQNVQIRLWRVGQLYLVGAFFNLFLLGSTGGDALKLFYILRRSERSQRAGIILSVIMDRLLGLLALILLATVIVGLRYHWLTQTRITANLVNSFAVLLLCATGALAAVFIVIKMRLVDRLPTRLPGRSKLIELAGATEVYTRAWPTFLAGVSLSFIGHSSLILAYYFPARAIGAAVKLWDMAAVVPIVNTIVALPISVSGVGVREALFKDLLKDLCGVGDGQSVPISVMGFVCTVIFSGLVGGIVYLFFRSEVGAAPPNAEELEARMEADELPAIAAKIPHPRGAADV